MCQKPFPRGTRVGGDQCCIREFGAHRLFFSVFLFFSRSFLLLTSGYFRSCFMSLCLFYVFISFRWKLKRGDILLLSPDRWEVIYSQCKREQTAAVGRGGRQAVGTVNATYVRMKDVFLHRERPLAHHHWKTHTWWVLMASISSYHSITCDLIYYPGLPAFSTDCIELHVMLFSVEIVE